VIGALPVLGLGLLQLPALLQGNLWGASGLLTWRVPVALAAGTATARLRLA